MTTSQFAFLMSGGACGGAFTLPCEISFLLHGLLSLVLHAGQHCDCTKFNPECSRFWRRAPDDELHAGGVAFVNAKILL